MKKNRQAGFATRAIHDGQEPDPLTGAVTVPMYPTSTYVQQGIGENKVNEFSRVSNPTRTRLEQNLASLEGGVAAPVFASGMAAINAVASLLKSGDHVVCGNDFYGGTPRLFNQVLTGFGLGFLRRYSTRKTWSAPSVRTRAWVVETPTNPLMSLSDLVAKQDLPSPKSRVGRRQHVYVALLSAAVSIGRRYGLALDHKVSQRAQRRVGRRGGMQHARPGREAGLSAEGRGRDTFSIRMLAGAARRENAGRTHGNPRSQWPRSRRVLARHKKVSKVFYPGLPDHPQHELAKRQMSGFGSMITFETGSLKNANKMLKKLRVCSLGESLGGVKT